MNDEQTLVEMLNNDLAIQLPPRINMDEIKAQLASFIKQWIESDFQRLVNLLYRVDVNENKLRSILNENLDGEADMIIAKLIIERQLEKVKTRKAQRNNDATEHGEEKW
jgi:MoxR-like ATPase